MKKRKIYFACAAVLTISVFASVNAFAEPENTAQITEAAEAEVSYESLVDGAGLFSDRDLNQTPNEAGAAHYAVKDNEDISITAEGKYVISGTASNCTIYVEANDQNKVQLILKDLHISNDSRPCIYVKQADKTFITVSEDSSLAVNGKFLADEENNAEGAIFSKQDLIMNGTATLTITSTESGVISKDDLKVTGGTYIIDAQSKAFSANDSIRIADGTFTLTAGTDALHAENKKDDSKGYIYIGAGTFTIEARDDAIHAVPFVQIDGGTFTINAGEGMEATYVQINGGEIAVTAVDDGVNAGRKSNAYAPTFEMNGGSLSIEMGVGDTDAIDSNGDIIVNGGTVNVTAHNSFDCDGEAVFNGGTIIVNGEEQDTIPLQ